MGYLNDLINKGAFATKNPLSALAPAPIPTAIARPAAPAPAPLSTQWAKPAVTTMPAYRAPAPRNVAPAPTNWGGGGGGSAQPSAGAQSFAAQAPVDIGAMAETDSTFTDQKSMYANALKKYLEDTDRQETSLKLDASTAQKGIARNREVGLTGLSEDFAARGLSNSGLAVDSRDKASDQYKKQDENVTTGLTNATGDLNFRKSKFIAENGENGTNVQAARREAYARLAAAQNLT